MLATCEAGSVTAETDADGTVTALVLTPNEGFTARMRIEFRDVQFFDSGPACHPVRYPLPAIVDPNDGLTIHLTGQAT